MVVHPRRRPRQFSDCALSATAVQPEDIFRAAEQRSLQIEVTRPLPDAAVEKLRADCAGWFNRLPEPPVYCRVDDPIRKQAERLVEDGAELLVRALCFARAPESEADEPAALIDALKANLEMLSHIAEGRLDKAEVAWAKASELEPLAIRARKLWVRSDERAAHVFDRSTGESRYDPRPEPLITVKLACPNTSCQSPADYRFSPRYATHRFICAKCRRPFIGYFGECRGVEITALPRGWKRYLFRLEELDGGLSRVEFEEPSGAAFNVAHRDLLAFLYTADRQLKSVLNLSSSRLLWIQRAGACFIATVAFGEDARELAAFRRFRDERLMPHVLGRAFVRGYYRVGPTAARAIASRPRVRSAVRGGLSLVHRWLE